MQKIPLLDLSTLIARMADDAGLPRPRRIAHCSSLRVFARCMGLDPHAVPVSVDYFREKLPLLTPAKTKLSRVRVAAIKTSLGFALEYAGLGEGIRCPRNKRIDAEFLELLSRVPSRWRRVPLIRLFAFCTAGNISPSNVDSEVLARFCQYVLRHTLAPHARRTARRARDAWNMCSKEIEGWPQTILKFGNRCVPVPAEQFELELDQYRLFLAGDLCHPVTNAVIPKPLSRLSVRLHVQAIRRCVDISRRLGRKPQSIEELVQQDSVEAIHAWLMQHKIGVTAKYIRQEMAKLCRAGQLWALHTVKIRRRSPAYSWERIIPSSIEKFRQIHDLVNANALRPLLELPKTLMNRALDAGLCPKDRNAAAQAALGLELMLMIPLLPAQVLELRIGRQLKETAADGSRLSLFIPALRDRTRILEYELPTRTTELIQVYRLYFVERWRRGALLLPSRTGTMRQPWAFSEMITRMIFKRVGIKLTMRAMRFLSGAIYLQRHANGYEAVRQAMGHTTLRHTKRMFSPVRIVHAFNSFDTLFSAPPPPPGDQTARSGPTS